MSDYFVKKDLFGMDSIMGALLHWSQAYSFELVVRQNHGRPQRDKMGIYPS